jgi:hypothetical protein
MSHQTGGGGGGGRTQQDGHSAERISRSLNNEKVIREFTIREKTSKIEQINLKSQPGNCWISN